MKALLLPILLGLLGTGAGVGAAVFLAEPEMEEITATCTCADDPAPTAALPAAPEDVEFAKLNNQFVIPVVEDARVTALVVMSLNIEVAQGSRPEIFANEPKLRDRFLQVMFNHANAGGFSGNFTAGTAMQSLRSQLLNAAKDVSGDIVSDVLIIDIVRQDT